MFKIGNSKELPTIPDYLSDEGKDFVKLCLQRVPQNRPSAAKLLEHSFVKNVVPLEKQIPSPTSSDHPPVTNAAKSVVLLLIYLGCLTPAKIFNCNLSSSSVREDDALTYLYLMFWP